MDVSVENPGGLTRRLKVQIPAERVNEAVDAKVKRVGQHARIPGFRPGKAPMKVLYQRYGAQARQEAVGELIQSAYPEALEKAELNPPASRRSNWAGSRRTSLGIHRKFRCLS